MNENNQMSNAMKLILSTLTSISLISMILLSSCKKDDDPTPEELASQQLSYTWEIDASGLTFVKLDGQDVTSWFNSFALTFRADGTYTANSPKSPSPWPPSGNWFFSEMNGVVNTDQITRVEDGLLIDIIQIDEENLVVQFQFDEQHHNSGRTGGLQGEYVFAMKRTN